MRLNYFEGDIKHTFVNDNYEGFKIYLHEKGQFWLSSPLEKLGQSKGLFIPLNTEQESKPPLSAFCRQEMLMSTNCCID